MRNPLLLIFTILNSLFVLGQNPKLEVLTDSVQIGEPFQVSLTYNHKSNSEVFFADSTYNYGDLEYLNHTPFPTQTDSLSLDSAIYTLACFNIQDSTEVKLPLYILSKEDSIKIESNSDFIFVKRILTQIPDSLELKTQLDYLESPILRGVHHCKEI